MTIESEENAKLIAQQLTQSIYGTNILKAMIGAKHFVYDGTKPANLAFKFHCCKEFNYCRIELDPMDTYIMELAKLNKHGEKINCLTLTGIYHDHLREIFEEHTKLFLSV